MAFARLPLTLIPILFVLQTAQAAVIRAESPSACYEAFKQCDFRFQAVNDLPTFSISERPNDPFTPRIISTTPGESLGVLNKNGIMVEFILPNGDVQSITAAEGATLSATHFKPLTMNDLGGSGIAHENFDTEQVRASGGRCVRMFFAHYQTLFPDRDVVLYDMDDTISEANKCIVFRTKA